MLPSLILLALLAVEIDGPAEFQRDSLAIYRLTGAPAKGPIWWETYPRLRPDQVRQTRTDLVLVAPPGTIEIQVFGWNPETNEQFRLNKSVTCREGKNPLPTPPTPGPSPAPPTPTPPVPPSPPAPPAPSPLGLVAWSAEKIAALPPAAAAKKAAVSAGLRDVAGRLKSGALGIMFASEIKRVLHAAYGDQSAAWEPLEKQLLAKLMELKTAGKIVGWAGLATALAEVADGIDQAKAEWRDM